MRRGFIERRAIALGFLVAAAVPAVSEALTADEIRRLEAGEVLVTTEEIPGRSLPLMKATGLVEAEPEAVWRVVDDCGRYAGRMPHVIESEELERDGNRVRCRATLDMPFPFGDLVTESDAVHTVKPGELYRREWEHLAGDFEANEGSWTLEPWDEGRRTLATYEALTEPKVAIPQFMLRIGTKVALPGMIKSLREHVETEPPVP